MYSCAWQASNSFSQSQTDERRRDEQDAAWREVISSILRVGNCSTRPCFARVCRYVESRDEDRPLSGRTGPSSDGPWKYRARGDSTWCRRTRRCSTTTGRSVAPCVGLANQLWHSGWGKDCEAIATACAQPLEIGRQARRMPDPIAMAMRPRAALARPVTYHLTPWIRQSKNKN
ncbi:hypothetical protein LX32DRAFT_242142 [Colletotrichum zoysiae]|uniref:Uncharacterized protein n=1 Tax=Colletotrichum zoysiae TaxID=1216348 RepID=A0AAD9H3V1_9PEZI|nr:hypothetical protein LX32DRAFT_242142 [Colletotrichum zoysiae]